MKNADQGGKRTRAEEGMKRWIAVSLVALSAVGCVPNWATQNNSDLLMRIVDVDLTSGSGDTGEILNSDISDTFNDDAVLTVELLRKNPRAPSVPVEDVVLESYQVRYFRTDGQNREGVDVPFRFTGPLHTRIHAPTAEAETTAEVLVNVVRHQAKQEPPLKNMLGVNVDNGVILAGGQLIVTMVAEITVYGRTTNDRTLSATTRAQVNFADFADE
jgi:hypothetical protein